MTISIRAATIVVALAVSALSLSAHHTIATIYDVMQRVTLKGVVAEVEWKQPHVMIHLDVTNGEGRVLRWDVETQGPLVLRRRGVEQDFAKPVETITVTVCVAKEGGKKGWLHEIASTAGTATLNAGGC